MSDWSKSLSQSLETRTHPAGHAWGELALTLHMIDGAVFLSHKQIQSVAQSPSSSSKDAKTSLVKIRMLHPGHMTLVW